MFNLVHKHNRIVQVILGLLVIPFAIWGVESYNVGGSRGTVATVNGIEISQREFEEQLRQQQEQLRRMLGRNYDPAILDSPASRAAVLDSLISQRLMASAAMQGNLVVADDMLVEVIHSVPAFQEGGQFSKAQYEAALRMQSPPMTPAQFEARLRHDLPLQQLGRAVADSAIAPRSVSERLVGLETQVREVSEFRIPAKQFIGQVKLEEGALKEYYDANASEFRTPERVKAQYVLLSADALARGEQISDEEVRRHWEGQYGKQFAERGAARNKIDAILAEARKDPGRFAEIAKERSDDRASAEQGGDLDFQPRGSFVKPFEDALYRMKVGQISGVVETEFGFHVIRLTDVRKKDGKEERRASHILVSAPADARPLAEMRPQIEAELKKQRGGRLFAEAAEAFSNLVYEQPDSLQPAAERFKLPVRTTPWITRSPGQELGPLDDPKLLAALFSQDALKNKRNTDAIEVAPGTMVSARVAEHQPAAQRSFDDVKAEIAEKLRLRKAAELAQKAGAEKLEQLRKGADVAIKWGPARPVSRRDPKGLPGDILTPVVSADVSKLPAYVGIPIPETGYLLLRISKVMEGDRKAAGAEPQARASQLYGGTQYQSYLDSLRAQADIEIMQEALQKK